MRIMDYRPMVEALLFAHGEPVSAEKLAEAMQVQTYVVEEVLQTMKQEYEDVTSGLRLLQLEDRWQLVTKNEYAAQVKSILDKRRNVPLTPAAMEVLAIIAYNQPVSRSFIEQVRGIDSSSLVTRLVERGLIEEAGRLDLPGRPIAFRTTDTFLRVFGIGGLGQLPRLHDDTMEETQVEEQFEQTSLSEED